MATTTAQGKPRALAAALAFALLLAGGVIGVSIDRLWVRSSTTQPKKHHWSKKHTPKHIVQRFRAKLDLTDEQAERIEAIITRIKAQMHEARLAFKPKMRAAHERAQKQILELLNEDQVVQYKKMIKDNKRHHVHKRHH